jgi:hypothetical protein
VLAAFNLISAIPVVIWMLPSVPQLLDFFKTVTVLQTPLGVAWARDLWSHVAAGILYENPFPDEHNGTSWVQQAAVNAWWTRLMGWTLAGLAGLGLLASLVRASAGRLLIWGAAGAGGLAVVHNALAGQSMLSWYLLYLLIPLCLAVVLGALILAPWRARIGPAVVMMVVAIYAAMTGDARSRFVEHPRQAIREAAHSYLDPHPEALAAVFGVSDRQIRSYDPRAVIVASVSDLDAAIERARMEGRPLFAVFCGREESRRRHPELISKVLEGGDFQPFAKAAGLEAMFSYEILRWTPRP